MAMILYFSPGTCSTASRIGLEESGAIYEERPTILAKGEHRTEAYLKISPRAKVPALVVDGHVITENTAILTYVARRFPEKNLLPADPLQEAHCIGTMAWFSNAVHPPFSMINRPERFADDEALGKALSAAARKAFWAKLQEIDQLLGPKTWMLGSQYTVADSYALVFYGWGLRTDFPVAELKHYTAWRGRMLERPAVRRILESEQKLRPTLRW
jgi:glutathione S-transferase